MVRLHECPACARHVRIDETRCPFCATEVDAPSSLPLDTVRRGMRRLAIFTVGAAMVGATASGCGASHELDSGVASDAAVAVDAGSDAGSDAGQDAGFDAGSIALPYGAPPADDLLV